MRLLAHRTLVDAARQYYAQPHRAYHDAHHLDELIALAREHTPDLDEAEQLALLFHDAVYLPGAPRGDNERRSAALMTATLATLARDHAALDIGKAVRERAGEIDFYETMLAKPRLFATDRFFERFEQPARANMRRALAGR
jgi:predicted metal-dependent HD superfamily phosphohydrolase